ncbi:MAG TPA: adenine phosphoribosyltransferase [Gemmatimonadota bacterium]
MTAAAREGIDPAVAAPPALGGGAAERLRAAIRDVPDFPRPGIVFRDLTPALADAALLRELVGELARPWNGRGVTHVAAIEARGFLLAGGVADRLGAGVVPLRKPGKLPRARRRVDYDLEYGVDALEAHADALGAGDAVLVLDDVLATGGTARAAIDLVQGTGSRLVGAAFLVELAFLAGRNRLGDADVHVVLTL